MCRVISYETREKIGKFKKKTNKNDKRLTKAWQLSIFVTQYKFIEWKDFSCSPTKILHT